MGLIPVGDRKTVRLEPSSSTEGSISAPGGADLTATVKVQAMFMIAGSAVGILGVILPHPEEFMVPELLALNISSIIYATGYMLLAPRIPEWLVRTSPALGPVAITVAVILSRDPTSAYALLYLFPAVY